MPRDLTQGATINCSGLTVAQVYYSSSVFQELSRLNKNGGTFFPSSQNDLTRRHSGMAPIPCWQFNLWYGLKHFLPQKQLGSMTQTAHCSVLCLLTPSSEIMEFWLLTGHNVNRKKYISQHPLLLGIVADILANKNQKACVVFLGLLSPSPPFSLEYGWNV